MGVLRVLLAISVVLAHTGPLWGLRLCGGEVAVETFFIISGFYMSLILETKYTGSDRYKLFITNRLLRIFPVYWALLVLIVITSSVSGALTGHWKTLAPYIQLHQYMGPGAFLLAVVSNIVIFGQDVVMFLGLDPQSGAVYFTQNFNHERIPFYWFSVIMPAWTLGIELVFYLMAPLILGRDIRLLLGLITGSLCLRLFIYRGLGWMHDPWTYRFFPTELFFFLAGNIAYRIYGRIKDDRTFKARAAVLAAALFAAIFFYANIPLGPELKLWSYCIIAVVSIPFIFYLSRSSAIDSRIGDLSYPIYLVHLFVIQNSGFTGEQLARDNFKILIVLALVGFSACLLLKFIADPVEKFRQARVLDPENREPHILLPPR